MWAQKVIGIYLFEGAVRTVLSGFIDLREYVNNAFLFVIIFGYAFVTMIICSVIEFIRVHSLAYIELPLSKIAGKYCSAYINFACGTLKK